jgi:uncharacterized membrane protein
MNKKLLSIIGLLIISLAVSWNLIKPGYFTTHDDSQVMRLFEMKRCLSDGQIPCRWSPDLGAGYGQPMFNYYSATPYYTGAIFKTIGFSYIDSTKIVMFISIALAGIAMFLFLSEFLSLLPAFIGGVAYLLVPFRALEIFVRGAVAENFALALLPLVLYGVIRLVKKHDQVSFVMLSLFSGLFLASHNITSLISSLLILVFSIVTIFLNKSKLKSFLLLFFSALLGLGLASFFLLPVIFESSLINTTLLTSGYFDFRAHFATLSQLFLNRSWGYGASEFGPNDNLSFAVGIVQTLAFVSVPVVLFFKRKTLHLSRKITLITFWGIGFTSLFLTTIRSVAIWDALPVMSFIQFPWRFLGVVAVCSSVVLATILSTFSPKVQKVLSIVTVIALIVINIGYFKFEKTFPNASDDTYLTGEGYSKEQKSAFFDYRPLSMVGVPEKIAPPNPVVLSGLAEVKNFQKRSAYFSADVQVYAGKATVAFPISAFPNWTVYLNSSITPTKFETGNEFGEITLTFDKGITLVQGYFENTPVRTLGNTLTLLSLILILVIVTVPHDKKILQ